MKLICKKNILIQHIQSVSKAVSNKTTLPVLECFLLRAQNNQFTLLANDLEISMESSPIECSILEEGNVALDAKLFSEIIKKLPEDEIYMETNEHLITEIKSGKSKYKIMGQSADDFPELPQVRRDISYTISQSNFKNLIRRTLFSIGSDESKPILTGVLLEIKQDNMNMVSVDGYRISYAKTPTHDTNEEMNVVIPGKTIAEINKLLNPNTDDETLTLIVEKNYVVFQLPQFELISRVINGDFIPYQQSFIHEFSTKIWINKQELMDSIERVSLISREGKKNPVKLIIKNQVLQFSSQAEMGSAFDEMRIESEGSDLEIGFNPKYLTDPLKVIDDEQIVLQFSSPLSPLIIFSEENDAYKYLVLPLRL